MIKIYWICLSMLTLQLSLQGQRILSEGTLQYLVTALPQPGQENLAKAFEGTTQTVWFRGNLARIDFASTLRKQTTFFNGTTGEGSILRESGTDKYQWNLTTEQWKSLHKKWHQIKWEYGAEMKEMGGYLCQIATGSLVTDEPIKVYLTKQILPLVQGYEPMFAGLDGLPIQYEMVSQGLLVKFSLISLQTIPVGAARFEIPESGYKLLEIQKLDSVQK
jgi:GLPGLI family protein